MVLITGDGAVFPTSEVTCGLSYTTSGRRVELHLMAIRHRDSPTSSTSRLLPIFFANGALRRPELGGSRDNPWIVTNERDVICCPGNSRNAGPDFDETVTFRLTHTPSTVAIYDVYVGNTSYVTNDNFSRRQPSLKEATNVQVTFLWRSGNAFTYDITQGITEPSCHVASLTSLGDGRWMLHRGLGEYGRNLFQIAHYATQN